jgi:hypothetical protein
MLAAMRQYLPPRLMSYQLSAIVQVPLSVVAEVRVVAKNNITAFIILFLI